MLADEQFFYKNILNVFYIDDDKNSSLELRSKTFEIVVFLVLKSTQFDGTACGIVKVQLLAITI